MNAQRPDVLSRTAAETGRGVRTTPIRRPATRAAAAPGRTRAVPRALVTIAATVPVAVLAVLLVVVFTRRGGWSAVGSAIAHHVDSVVAAVLLAASLAVVWRLGEDER